MKSWLSEHIDLLVVFIVLGLLTMGIISIYSATYDTGSQVLFQRQLTYAGIGFLLMVAILVMPYRTLQLMSYPLYAVSMIMLILILIAGKVVAGSKSWFGIGGFGLQPSELAKVTTIMALAAYLSQRGVNLHHAKDVVVTFAIALLPVALILGQPDMGTAIIYVAALFFIMYWAGASNFLLLTFIAPGAAAIASLFGTTAFVIVIALTFVFFIMLRKNRLMGAITFSLTVLAGVSTTFIFSKLLPHQQKRILTFLNPDGDPLGAGYNVAQSKIAIGSGGLFGKGFLQGTQTQLNFLPAQWTDFIYCVPSEEFGFIGAFLILILLTGLLLRGVHTASTVKSRYAAVVAIGVVSVLAVHTIINIGMAMGIMPVIGVPLPFLSYGGSNLISNMIMAGLLLHMYANRKEY
ncbi:MAG TPA: rod shape-determining protein RodA [Bacteroidota bacterium]|jgi:rod shape determining protein RodA|nr:rod shape-determining protein RodA [Bacteroidota bacterium]